MKIEEGELINPVQAAKIIGVKPSTLAIWRCYRTYDLPFYRASNGKRVFYKEAEVWAFVENRRKKLAE